VLKGAATELPPAPTTALRGAGEPLAKLRPAQSHPRGALPAGSAAGGRPPLDQPARTWSLLPPRRHL